MFNGVFQFMQLEFASTHSLVQFEFSPTAAFQQVAILVTVFSCDICSSSAFSLALHLVVSRLFGLFIVFFVMRRYITRTE